MANSKPSQWSTNPSSKWQPYDATKDKNSKHYKPPTPPKTNNTTTTQKKENNYYYSSSVPEPSYDAPNYVTSDNSYSGGYNAENSYMALLKKQEKEQKRAAELARQAAEDARKASYNAGSKALGLSAEEALRQAYISKTQAQGYLPQQSALIGAGGMTESSLAQLNAGYGNNRASIEAAKIGGLADLESQLQQGLAGDVSAYQNKLGEIGSQSMTAQLAYQQKLEDIARQERYAAEEARAKASMATKAYSGRVSGSSGQSGGGGGTGDDDIDLWGGDKPKEKEKVSPIPGMTQFDIQNIDFWKSQGYTDEQIAQMLSKATGKYY